MRINQRMWTSALALLLTTVLVSGCSDRTQAVVDMLGSQLNAALKVNQTISKDSKWYNSSIEGAIDETLQVSEKDDFYTAVNKDWILAAEVNDEQRSVGTLLSNTDDVNERITELIAECAASDQLSGSNNVEMPEEQYLHTQELLGQFVSVLEDREGRDEQGVEPARAYIEAIENIQTLDQMTEYIENKSGTNYGMTGLVPISMEIPRSVHDQYTVYLGQNPQYVFSDPRSYYSISVQDTLVKEVVVDYVKPILVQLGYTPREAVQIIRNSFNLEGRLAEGMDFSDEASESLEAYKEMDHFYSYEDLQKMQGNYPLTEILDAWGLGESEVINIESVDYIKNASRLYKEKNLRKLKDYMIVNTLMDMLPYLDQNSYDAYDMLYKVQYDTQTSIPEEDYVETFVNVEMSEVLQEVYIGRYCDAKQKQEISEIIDETIAYYRTMLQSEDWLTEETRNLAIEKLDNLCYRVLYPNQMTDYSTVIFDEDDTLIDMIAKLNQFRISQLKNKVNKEVDRYDWNLEGMSTLAMNAYYMPTDNSINILAGILANGFVFDENAPDEMNLGRLGVIIGHEITHGFDTSGYAFDQDGIPNKWWTYEDEEQFQIRASHLAKYFSTLSAFPDSGPYNGDNVKAEAIADMGGMKCMLGIAKERENFDYDLFFTSYAQLWASKSTFGYETMLIGDEHPLDCFRVNVTLQQFDEFMETYDIQPGDGMYLSPEKRILVW